jgi:ABC-2 type transport system ATP-binding protein
VRSPQAEELRARLAAAGIESQGIDSTLLVRGTTPERVGEIAADAQIVLHELVAETSSLEEVFLGLTQGET